MRRLFWVAVGATAGVAAVRKAQRVARSYAPSSLAGRAGGVADRVHAFSDDVRAAMAARERELRTALGIDEAPLAIPGPAETPADANLLEHPTRHRRSTG